MEAFFAAFPTLPPLPAAAHADFVAAWQRAEHPKGYQLVTPGSTCQHIYFLETGLARTFYYHDGRDVTDWLAPEGTLAVSLISFISRTPDRRGVELLETAVVWSLGHQQLEDLCARHHAVEHLARQLVSQGAVQLQQRFDALHFASATERYQQLLRTAPGLLQRVPLGMVASFLGITQETLSRIRTRQV